ncbi:MAG: hypothetical protein GW763_06185 [Paraglaciecola sp.]|nr:hypothetical protein [Paraglaciecola sp.]NCT47572.1 hypothetical protein [Paraglaciecola sp.]
MKRFIHVALFSFVSMSFGSGAEQPLPISADEQSEIKISGFECANDIMHIIPLLGRGPDFPDFIVKDIEKELDRQKKGSYLKKVECTGNPEIKVTTLAQESNAEMTELSSISVSFPVSLIVSQRNNRDFSMPLNVEQNYFVEHLDDPSKTKVTQNFIVKK